MRKSGPFAKGALQSITVVDTRNLAPPILRAEAVHATEDPRSLAHLAPKPLPPSGGVSSGTTSGRLTDCWISGKNQPHSTCVIPPSIRTATSLSDRAFFPVSHSAKKRTIHSLFHSPSANKR